MVKRSLAILASTAIFAVLVAPTADAKGPTQLAEYGAGSSATALVLSLVGQELAVSSTVAAVGSTPEAAADGAALLLAGSPVPGAAPSSTNGGQPTNSACPIDIDLDALTGGALSGLGIQIACLNTAASLTDGAPSASSQSGEVKILLNGLGGDVLTPILTPILTPLLAAVTQATDPICVALGPLCTVVDQTVDIDIPALLDEIIADLDQLDNGLFTVAEIAVGPTLSRASANDVDGVVAQAGSTATTIKLFPGLESTIEQLTGLIPSPGDALVTAVLGNATAGVTRNASTGASTPTASAAQLLSIDVTDTLGIVADLVGTLPATLDNLAIDQLSCDGGVLADVLCIDLGAVHDLDAAGLTAHGYDFGAGTVGKEASAASVRVLPILADALGGDVLSLSLATASAAANATPAQVPPTTAPPSTPRGLPRTGGTTDLPLVVLLAGAAAVGLAVVRRTRATV